MKALASTLVVTSFLLKARWADTPVVKPTDTFSQGVKSLFEELHSDSQRELPRAPNSNPMAKYDYRNGDSAKTVGEFAALISPDFSVSYNPKAKDPDVFAKNPIIVYGEIHTEPKIPSLRTPKGVVLLESDDPDRCLPKFQLHAENRCVFIDKAKVSSEEKVYSAVRETIQSAQKVVDLIQPGAMQKLQSSVLQSSGQATALVQKAIEFVDQNFDKAQRGAKSDKIRSLLLKTRDEFHQSIGRFNAVLQEGLPDRDKAMLTESVKQLKAQKPDESAVVVVGDLHVSALIKGLNAEFPNRAVVAARPRHAYF